MLFNDKRSSTEFILLTNKIKKDQDNRTCDCFKVFKFKIR